MVYQPAVHARSVSCTGTAARFSAPQRRRRRARSVLKLNDNNVCYGWCFAGHGLSGFVLWSDHGGPELAKDQGPFTSMIGPSHGTATSAAGFARSQPRPFVPCAHTSMMKHCEVDDVECAVPVQRTRLRRARQESAVRDRFSLMNADNNAVGMGPTGETARCSPLKLQCCVRKGIPSRLRASVETRRGPEAGAASAWVFFSVVAAVHFLTPHQVSGGNVTASERQALTDFYVAMNGSRWLNNTGWTALPSGGDPCNPTAVFGVTCTNTSPNHIGYALWLSREVSVSVNAYIACR